MSGSGMPVTEDLVLFTDSPIHGRGGFARVDLEEEIPLLEYSGERISKEESLRRCLDGNTRIFHLDEQWDLDGDVETNEARWLNHSCAPNCEARLEEDDRIWITTLRPISAGEELTFNYGYDLEELEAHPCQCGKPECVGYIVAEEFYDVARRRMNQARELSADPPAAPSSQSQP